MSEWTLRCVPHDVETIPQRRLDAGRLRVMVRDVRGTPAPADAAALYPEEGLVQTAEWVIKHRDCTLELRTPDGAPEALVTPAMLFEDASWQEACNPVAVREPGGLVTPVGPVDPEDIEAITSTHGILAFVGTGAPILLADEDEDPENMLSSLTAVQRAVLAARLDSWATYLRTTTPKVEKS